MEVTTSKLLSLLDGIVGVRCHPEPVEDRVLFVLKGGSHMIEMFGVPEQGGVVQLRSFRLLFGPEKSYRTALLRALFIMNYQYKLVKFAFDASDGEVVGYVDLGVAGTGLTKQQIQRAINLARPILVAGKLRAERIVKTGKDPGDTSEEAKREVAADMSGIAELAQRLQEMRAAAGGESRDKKSNGGAKKPRGGLFIDDDD